MAIQSDPFSNFFLHSDYFFYILLDEQGHCIFANKCLLQGLGYQADQLAGHSYTKIVYEHDAELFWQAIRECVTQRATNRSIIIRVMHQDGHLLRMRWELSVFRANGEEILGIQAVGCKIDMGLEKQKEITDRRKILKAIFDSTNNVKFFVAPDHSILFFNKKAYDNALIFHKKELKVGDNMLDYTRSTTNNIEEKFKHEFNRALQGETVLVESRIEYGKNLNFWFQTEYFPVYDDGNIIGITITVTDISERKKHEQNIKKQNELLQSIAHIQSHKTRQPVSTILGLVSIFNREALSEENRKVLELLEITTHKLDKVIHQIVDKTNSLDVER